MDFPGATKIMAKGKTTSNKEKEKGNDSQSITTDNFYRPPPCLQIPITIHV